MMVKLNATNLLVRVLGLVGVGRLVGAQAVFHAFGRLVEDVGVGAGAAAQEAHAGDEQRQHQQQGDRPGDAQADAFAFFQEELFEVDVFQGHGSVPSCWASRRCTVPGGDKPRRSPLLGAAVHKATRCRRWSLPSGWDCPRPPPPARRAPVGGNPGPSSAWGTARSGGRPWSRRAWASPAAGRRRTNRPGRAVNTAELDLSCLETQPRVGDGHQDVAEVRLVDGQGHGQRQVPALLGHEEVTVAVDIQGLVRWSDRPPSAPAAPALSDEPEPAGRRCRPLPAGGRPGAAGAGVLAASAAARRVFRSDPASSESAAGWRCDATGTGSSFHPRRRSACSSGRKSAPAASAGSGRR